MDGTTQPDVAYCQIAPVIQGTSPTAQVSGFIMRPDGSLVQVGGPGSYQFTVFIPFSYGMSVQQLQAEVLPAIQTQWGMPGLQAQVEFLPFV
jgi:hypothetical protein